MKMNTKTLIHLIVNIFVFSNLSIFAQSPIAYWSLDESTGTVAYDSTGNYTGNLHGCNWQSSGAKINGALQFNGNTDYVSCGTSIGSSSSLSVAFWVKPTMLKYQIPVDKLPVSGNAGWSVKLRDNGDIWMRIGSALTHDDIIISNAYQTDTWLNFIFTYDEGQVAVCLK